MPCGEFPAWKEGSMSTTSKAVQHTPGPWELDFAKDGGCRYQIIMGQLPKELTQKDAAYGYPIADTMNRHYCVSPEEDEANARLIAAAPEMLDMLVRIKNMAHRGWEDKSSIREIFELIEDGAEAAIQKARGEQ